MRISKIRSNNKEKETKVNFLSIISHNNSLSFIQSVKSKILIIHNHLISRNILDKILKFSSKTKKISTKVTGT